MAKNTTLFVCKDCGYEAPKWLGRCPGCGLWNTLLEESVLTRVADRSGPKIPALSLADIPETPSYRFSSGIGELDRVLGGGIVPGSLILLGGDPGIGKSTLLLQAADRIASSHKKVLYLSGEESAGQIRLRASRLGIDNPAIYFLTEQNIERLDEYLQDIDPGLVIIDSIQTVYAASISSIPGSITQLRESTAKIMELAKTSERVFVLVGHVTKEGALAGPKVLEHMVDVVIYFEGEKNFAFRLLRGIKNRFGATDEIGLLEMSGMGLKEVLDPSQIFLSLRDSGVSGSAVAASFEGSRPLLIEVQALVAPTGLGYARRMASGIDQNRLALIIAVLEKRRGFNLGAFDVYLKVTGGVFLRDPAADLGIAAAILSSYRDKPLATDMVFAGELGLAGDIRPVPFLEARLKESVKMGFRRVMVPPGASNVLNRDLGLEIVGIKNLDDFIDKVTEG